MTTAYFEKYFGPVTLAHCPSCGGRFRLVHFRKWWGGKRILRDLCNNCEPDKPLSEMTPNERANAVAAGRPGALPFRVAQMNEREATQHRYSRSIKRAAAHSKERRRNWARAVGDTLREERDWAQRNLVHPASDEWERFFEVYLRVVKDALARVETHVVRRGAPLKPTMEQTAMRYWVYPETLDQLRSLYSRCPVVRGRRLYRDPAFLTW